MSSSVMLRRGHEWKWLNTLLTSCKLSKWTWNTAGRGCDLTPGLICSSVSSVFCLFLWRFVICFIDRLFNRQSSVVLMAIIDRLIYDLWYIEDFNPFRNIPDLSRESDPWSFLIDHYFTNTVPFRNLRLFCIFLSFYLFFVCLSHSDVFCPFVFILFLF